MQGDGGAGGDGDAADDAAAIECADGECGAEIDHYGCLLRVAMPHFGEVEDNVASEFVYVLRADGDVERRMCVNNVGVHLGHFFYCRSDDWCQRWHDASYKCVCYVLCVDAGVRKLLLQLCMVVAGALMRVGADAECSDGVLVCKQRAAAGGVAYFNNEIHWWLLGVGCTVTGCAATGCTATGCTATGCAARGDGRWVHGTRRWALGANCAQPQEMWCVAAMGCADGVGTRRWARGDGVVVRKLCTAAGDVVRCGGSACCGVAAAVGCADG